MFPKLKNKTVLSPMAGVTDVAFRALAKHYGAALTFTEFISSAALSRKNEKTIKLLKKDITEKPIGVQLFGSNEDEVLKAAQFVEKDFDIIDINCGCPVWKVVRTGAGSAMLKDVKKIEALVSKIAGSVDKPVTVKIRTGIDEKHINAVEVARAVEAAGAAAITVHGRTQKQGYAGEADWSVIKRVKDSVSIPVIGNGDVFSPERFAECLEQSNVDAIMIARGAIGNPHIFEQISDYMKRGSYEKKSGREQFDEYLKLAEKYSIGFLQIKSHAIQFTKNAEQATVLRNAIAKCKNVHEIKEIFASLNLS